MHLPPLCGRPPAGHTRQPGEHEKNDGCSAYPVHSTGAAWNWKSVLTYATPVPSVTECLRIDGQVVAIRAAPAFRSASRIESCRTLIWSRTILGARAGSSNSTVGPDPRDSAVVEFWDRPAPFRHGAPESTRVSHCFHVGSMRGTQVALIQSELGHEQESTGRINRVRAVHVGFGVPGCQRSAGEGPFPHSARREARRRASHRTRSLEST